MSIPGTWKENNLHANQMLSFQSLYATFAYRIAFICTKAFNYCSNFSHLSVFYLQRQVHVHLIGSHSGGWLCAGSLWVCQLEEMVACIGAWNKAPALKWQVLDIVGKWMLNSLCNHQQQHWLWNINCTLAKGKGNCFARYIVKSFCVRSICQISLQKTSFSSCLLRSPLLCAVKSNPAWEQEQRDVEGS